MLKKIFIFILTIFSFTTANACDICGCGVGGNYIGLLPEFNKQIFGVRYRHNTLRTHIGNGGSSSYLTTNETYNTIELWGGWDIGKNFRIMASAPYSFNKRSNQGITKNKNGISDISINGYYQLLNKRKTVLSDRLLIQSLWLGGGIKLPTGKYNPADKMNTAQNTNLFQLGTASVDLTLNAMYDVRLQDAGLNISTSYKLNTSNQYRYRYGNKFNVSAQVYHKFNVKHVVTIAPNIGIMYETAAKDHDDQFPVDISGGRLLTGSIGLETALKKCSIGANWQTPLSQNLANGFVKTNNRMMVHISFIL